MIFHENRLLADDSHVISYLIFVENWENVANFVVCCSRDLALYGLMLSTNFSYTLYGQNMQKKISVRL